LIDERAALCLERSFRDRAVSELLLRGVEVADLVVICREILRLRVLKLNDIPKALIDRERAR
jgi:hypothetical protein